MIRGRQLIVVALTLAAFACPRIAGAQNVVAVENALPGDPPSVWDVNGAGDPSIQGFTTDISVNHGEMVHFKISTDATQYRIDIYRIGYYGGLGARKVATVLPSASLPQTQPAPITDETTGLVDCGNWSESASWAVPSNAVSGIYIAKLVREDPEDGRASHVLFVVRDDDRHSDLLLQANDETWQAYNTYGGNSLYYGSPAGRAYKVSYNRPVTTRCCNYPGGAIVTWFFSAPYPMVRWLEANGYDVSYAAGVDTDRRGADLLDHRVFVSVGHDEYWSGNQRANVEAARDSGVHLAFFSGNEVFWKTRWESSIDGSGTPYRTLVCYKETHAGAKIDPLPNVWTGSWRDPRFSPPADGGRPENALLGTIFIVNGITNNAIEVPEPDGKMRFWRNTSVAALTPGQKATFATGTLGFEWDTDLDNGFRPPGLFHLSSATWSGVPVLQDYGSTYASGTAIHHLMMHRAGSGALVFSAGTVQWSWGLDATHDNPGTPSDVRMQQATVNLFADMGVQPATLQAGLVSASASTDTAPPLSAITSPVPGATVSTGTEVTIAGTASDADGRVGGIEVSVDGGVTWHPAVGRESWSYAWTPGDSGTVTVRSRAVDDSGNLESPRTGVLVHVGAPQPGVCPCHLFATEGGPAANDPVSIEVGVRFRSDRDGFVSGLRFFKPGASTGGTHVGHLWSNTGQLLGTTTFTNETVSGWQEARFDSAGEVPITAGTLYVASVLMPTGNYPFSLGYFSGHSEDRAPLHAPADGAGGFANGVYVYGSGGFPIDTYASSNYWVDVVFDTAIVTVAPPCVSDLTSADFALGSFGNGAYAAGNGDGAVSLAPLVGEEFPGGSLPPLWSGLAWSAGGSFMVAGGALALDGARAWPSGSYTSGRSLEFGATFRGAPYQNAGLAADGDFNAPWAAFGTYLGAGLYARASDGTSISIPGNWLGTPHEYRIDWTGASFAFAADGAPVAGIPMAVASGLAPVLSDFNVGGDSLAVDWLRLSPYASSGTFESRIVDAGSAVTWGAASWTADVPAGTGLAMSVRTGDTPAPDGSWSAYTALTSSGAPVGRSARYLQYRCELSASDLSRTPLLRDVGFACVPATTDVAREAPRGEAPTVTPNPLTSRATIRYAVGEQAAGGRADVEVTIHDLQGRLVRTLERRTALPGRHAVEWNGSDGAGQQVEPAVYFYRVRIAADEWHGPIVVMR